MIIRESRLWACREFQFWMTILHVFEMRANRIVAVSLSSKVFLYCSSALVGAGSVCRVWEIEWQYKDDFRVAFLVVPELARNSLVECIEFKFKYCFWIPFIIFSEILTHSSHQSVFIFIRICFRNSICTNNWAPLNKCALFIFYFEFVISRCVFHSNLHCGY